MTVSEWMWTWEFWILAAPFTALLLGFYISEEAVDVENRRVDICKIILSFVYTFIFYIFMWVCTV